MQRTTDWNNERFHLFCAPRSTKFTHTQDTQLQHSHRLTSCNKRCFQCQTQPGIRALTCEESKACLRSNEIWEVKKHSSREPGKVTKSKFVNSFFHSPSISLSLSLSHTHTHTHTHSTLTHGQRHDQQLWFLACWSWEGAGGMSRGGWAEPTLIPSPALQQVLPCWRKEAFPSFLPTQPRPHGQCPPRGTLFSNYFLTYSNTFCASLFWLKK